MSASTNMLNKTLVAFASKQKKHQYLSNLYECREGGIPASDLFAAWFTAGLYTEEEFTQVRATLPSLGSRFTTAEAAYQAHVFIRGFFDGLVGDTRLSAWVGFLEGRKFTDPANLAAFTNPAGASVVSAKVAANLVKAAGRLGNRTARGKCAKFAVRQWPAIKKSRGPVRLFDQEKLWKPIHDLKFNVELNPDLHNKFKRLVERHGGQPMNFVELSSTLVHAKKSTWAKNPWAGGVRMAGPTTAARAVNTTFGYNFMGQLVGQCAVRLFHANVAPWPEPVEQYKTLTQIRELKAAVSAASSSASAAPKKVVGGKRRPKPCSAAKAQKVPARRPEAVSLEEAFAVIRRHVGTLPHKLKEAENRLCDATDAADAENASLEDPRRWKFSNYVDSETSAFFRQLTGVVCPTMEAMRGHLHTVAAEEAEGSERWTEVGFVDHMKAGEPSGPMSEFVTTVIKGVDI